jgi:hypothetical protein
VNTSPAVAGGDGLNPPVRVNPVADQPLNVAPVPGVKVQETDDPYGTEVVANELPGVQETEVDWGVLA